MSETFPPALRIRKRREYLELQKGRRRSTAHFVFFVRLRDDAEPSRLGLIVSRKVGCAVVRNLVKRRSRELFRRGLGAQLGSGVDLVALAKPGAGELTWAAMQAEWCHVVPELVRRCRQ